MPKRHPDFAARLTAIMAEAGMSVAGLVLACGLPRQTIHRLLRGQRQPTWKTVQTLATALKVSTERLRTDGHYREG
jgi:transcriptional regulator with XRE-family HTH domain